MAGARLGFGIGCPELISDLVSIKYSTNPYNVNRVSAAMGIGALTDKKYFDENCRKIQELQSF
jgi:histidinol-phosphate aminotransferase